MFFVKSLSVFMLVGFVSCGPAPDMPQYESSVKVEMLNADDEKSFYLLPLKGEVRNGEKFWSGDYWPLSDGMINLRWNSPTQEGWDYTSPHRDDLLFMPQENIAQLSPAEKFDIYMGRYEYPLKEEVYSYSNRNALHWEGICNGWAPASLNHNEPRPKTLTNSDGIVIPFGSADIKALLSYYYAYIHKVESTQQMGRRCPRGSGWFNWNKDCKNDLNAGSFHVVLTNRIGRRNESFMVDIQRYKEVWNHPIQSYISRVEGEYTGRSSHPSGTAKVVKMRTKISYVNESARNTWEPIRGTLDQKLIVREYTYDLYLDLKNDIIGGEWTSKDRPDFLWSMGPTREFKGLLEGLGVLLND